MTTTIKYAIENIETGKHLRTFGTLPKSLSLPDGRRVVSPVKVGDEGLGYRLIQINEVDFARPGTFYTQGEDVETRDGAVVTITRSWTAWTQEEIDAFVASARDQIAEFVADVDNPMRAALLVMLDEFNRSHAVARAIIAAGTNATSFADYRNRMSQITGIPERAPADLLGAVRQKLGVE